MKKLLLVVMVLGTLATNAQILENKGQFFVFKDPKYLITQKDLAQIAYAISLGKMQTGKLARLSSGAEVTPYFPEKWEKLMVNIFTKVKGSPVSKDSLYIEFGRGHIADWDDNISVTSINYGINSAGGIFANKGYHGAPGVRVFIYEGYPVLKTATPCLNPLDPNIPENLLVVVPKPVPAPKPAPTPAPVPEPKPKPEESEEEKRRQAYTQEVYLSQSQSQSFNHSRENFNQIKSSSVEGGGGLSVRVRGGGGSNNYQSGGLLNTCGSILSGQGDVSVDWQRPIYANNYENTSSSSSNTSTSNASSLSVGRGGNGNNQNYQKTQGVPQPSYGTDPNSFVNLNPKKKKALAVTADEY